MSEAAPILLNMGAEVASATGLNPMQGQSPATGNTGNEFAGVLQSVLNPASQPSTSNSLLAKELQVDPLLLLQPEILNNPLSAATEMSLDSLPTGNPLPSDEPQLAWKTLLAEYDSQDPDSPHVLLASGDEQSYEIQELTADDLLPQGQSQNAGTMQQDDLHKQQTPVSSLEALSIEDLAEVRSEEMPESPTLMAAVHAQDVPSTAKPVITGAEEEALSRLARAQANVTSKSVNSNTLDASAMQQDAEVTPHTFQNTIEQAAGFSKLDVGETVSNKIESAIAALAEQGVSAKPANLSGASSYATVSSLAANMPSSQPTAPIIANLTVPPQNPAWGDTVGDRVQWMVAQNIQEAKIRLHPQELGMLEVRIQMGSDQQTSISFSSPHSQVRDALETALPRLREMFGESGLSLGDVNVSQHSSSEQGHAERDNPSDSSSQSGSSPSHHESGDVVPAQQVLAQGNSMLDLYA